MSKRDDVKVLYSKSTILNECCQILFWTNCIFSILSLWCDGILNSVSVLVQILTSILYVILMSIDDGHYWYMAESARRKDNLQVGLGINLSDLETDGYYNNQLEPSIIKYAMNTFESNFFSKEIAAKMLVKSLTKAIVAVFLLISIDWFNTNQEIILVITQSVLSTYIVEETIMLAFYKSKLEKLYDLIYAEFITIGITKKSQQNLLLYYVVEYESIKSYYKVRISYYIFNKYNGQLSQKWDDIKTKCKIKKRLS